MKMNGPTRVSRFLIAGTLLLGCAPWSPADVRLPALFSEHLVLQQGAATPVWGWAAPGEKVTVTLAGQAQTATADAQGKWQVKFAGLKAGGPHTLTAAGRNTVTVGDVLIGEVWLGSGQSNMAMPVQGARDFEQEQAAADLPTLRMFTVTSGGANEPQADCRGAWVVCAPATVGRFSAALYFCGRELHRALGVPVGLINSSVGGTPIEFWISAAAQRQAPELKAFFATEQKQAAAQAAAPKAPAAGAAKTNAAGRPARPAARRRGGAAGNLFNGKIAPLIPCALRGVVWYQGESNANGNQAPFYQYQLPLLVQDWRARWGAELPFAWVQLPNFRRPDEGWMIVREAMLKTLRVPQTGMAIAIDVGEAGNIHPKNKQAVGHRLALWALGTVYGKPVPSTSGPLPAGHEVQGTEMALTFTHADGGLQAQGGPLRGFEIAGADRQWRPARARIAGGKVIVSSPDVQQPAAVRYAWAADPTGNLFNGAGLPASPFRTDDRPGPAPSPARK